MTEHAGDVRTLGHRAPRIAESAWVAPGATVVGSVPLHQGAGVWYVSVLRANPDPISVGRGSNIQDLWVHTDPGFPCWVGAGMSVGDRAVLHGCTVEDDVLVGREQPC